MKKTFFIFVFFVSCAILTLFLINIRSVLAQAAQYECACVSGSINYLLAPNQATADAMCSSNCTNLGSTIRYTQANGCQSNANCNPTTEFCNSVGVCERLTNLPPGTCTQPSDCNIGAGENCINGTCQTGVAPTACQFPSDCNTGWDCINGTCQYSGGTGTGTGGNCVNDCLAQGNTPTECNAACGTGGGGGGGGANPNPNVGGAQMPGAPVGGATIPNWLGVTSIAQLITNIANFIVVNIATPLAILMIIIAGFRFATAQGNEEKIKKARQNFMWTVIGLAIVLAASLIVTYIRELLTGQGNTLVNFINTIKGTLNAVIGVLFALVTVYFIWGVIQYVQAGGDEEKLKQGKRHMVWGIIGMAIMGAAGGIAAMIGNYVTGH